MARAARIPLAAVLPLLAAGCIGYGWRQPIQWDARDQIWAAEASQVRVRAAQSQVFETADRTRTLEAVVATFQDLGFQVEVLDEELGIVSGKKYTGEERVPFGEDPSYHLYEEDTLVVFSRRKAFRAWGPFRRRSDLVRLTVTVRQRGERQLVVRAAAQFSLRPVEDPEPYRRFFRTLRQALFVDRELSRRDAAAVPASKGRIPVMN